MKQKELADRFLEFEEKIIFSKRIHCNMWMYIRHDIYELLCLKIGLRQKQDRCRYRYFKQWKLTPDQMMEKNTVGNVKNLQHKDILVIPHSRRIRCEDGLYKCIYTDLLTNRLSEKCFILDTGDVFQGFLPMNKKDTKYFDIDDFKKVINIPLPTRDDRIDEDWIDEILNELINIFDITLSKREINDIKTIAGSAKYYNRIYRLIYAYILEKVSPKVVVIVCYYSTGMMTLCEISKEYGIPVVELEHGLICDMYIDYNFLKKRNLKEFPDYIFTWGEKPGVRFPIDDDKIRKVGFPELESKVQTNIREKKSILFISAINREVAEYARYISDNIDHKKYDVIFKLHPLEYGRFESDYGEVFKDSNVEVITDTNRSIYDFLSISDWVVGTSSTAIFEATMFQTKIAVMESNEYEYCKELYENNYAVLVKNKEELLRIIESDSITLKKDDFFYKRNSLNRMESEIYRIVEGMN